MIKVPEITLVFWVIKVLTTAMGEATSDFLVFEIDPVIAVILGAIGLAVAMTLQLLVRRYVPWIYWLAVAMVAVFGTMGADVVHIGLGIPYAVSTAFFALALAVVFAAWYACERTLSIHSIYTPRRELFYWATVMATFALGTAAGDMTASTIGLGYFTSGVMFAFLFVLPGLAHRLFRLNAIAAFWVAYIPHPAFWCLVRRLGRQSEESERTRARHRVCQRGLGCADHHPRRLPERHPQGP